MFLYYQMCKTVESENKDSKKQKYYKTWQKKEHNLTLGFI